jgi:hypothetical protein
VTFPPEDRREPFLQRNPHTGVFEAGFITPGPCGGRHLEGPSFTWWRCDTCTALGLTRKRTRATRNLAQATKRMLDLFYTKDPR